jgi:hypothetical protein
MTITLMCLRVVGPHKGPRLEKTSKLSDPTSQAQNDEPKEHTLGSMSKISK